MYWLPLLLPQRHLVQNCSAALPLAAPTNEFIALMNSKSLLVIKNISKYLVDRDENSLHKKTLTVLKSLVLNMNMKKKL